VSILLAFAANGASAGDTESSPLDARFGHNLRPSSVTVAASTH